MTIQTDKLLAMNVGMFCGNKGYTMAGAVTLQLLDTGVWEVTYSLDYPPARVEHGKVVWPKGSPYDLVWGFIGG